VAQLSTITSNNFASPVSYLVTAADGSSTSYTVTVTVVPLSLGVAGNYVLLANTTITNTGPSIISGNISLYPGTSITGFPPGTYLGTVDINNSAASNAQNALISAYNQVSGLAPTTILSAATYATISNQTLTPGTYSIGTSLQVNDNLILSGDVNSVFIFQIGSTLTTAVGSNIVLMGGINPANVYWQVGSSATLGTSSILNGVLLANISITTNTNATVNGRIFAINGAIALDTNNITAP
jgi:type VI secretion system secreted protein VgrG